MSEEIFEQVEEVFDSVQERNGFDMGILITRAMFADTNMTLELCLDVIAQAQAAFPEQRSPYESGYDAALAAVAHLCEDLSKEEVLEALTIALLLISKEED